MSTKYKLAREVPTEVLCQRLEELSDILIHKRSMIAYEFTMRVPAECDRDADLVLAEAARRIATVKKWATTPLESESPEHEWARNNVIKLLESEG